MSHSKPQRIANKYTHNLPSFAFAVLRTFYRATQQAPGRPQRAPGRPQRAPARPQKAPARPQRGQARPQRGQARPQRGPREVQRGHREYLFPRKPGVLANSARMPRSSALRTELKQNRIKSVACVFFVRIFQRLLARRLPLFVFVQI